MRDNWQTILRALPRTLRSKLNGCEKEQNFGDLIWPNLALISCWADGPSAMFLDEIRACFPRVAIQPKGLLATEGIISIPWEINRNSKGLSNPDPLGCLAIGSHFLEFQDIENQNIYLAHELKLGRKYAPILTTNGGFYRYQLKDLVLCDGMLGKTPSIRFISKFDQISDLAGEKLHAHQTEQVIEQAFARLGFKPKFALIAPSLNPRPHYKLYVESNKHIDVSLLSHHCDQLLSQGYHYQLARSIEQLSAIEVIPVKEGVITYQKVLHAQGIKLGDIKPSSLNNLPIWDGVFQQNG